MSFKFFSVNLASIFLYTSFFFYKTTAILSRGESISQLIHFYRSISRTLETPTYTWLPLTIFMSSTADHHDHSSTVAKVCTKSKWYVSDQDRFPFTLI